jgi:D-cysteine desulfhydrase
VACARLGLRAHLILRGLDRSPPSGNLLLDRWVGAEVEFITAQAWPEVDALMAERAARYHRDGRTAYVVPEGGSNGLGCLGYARAARELLDDAAAAGVRIRRVVHAIGSGGTTAGLALGFAMAGATGVECIAVCVTDDAATFDAKIRHIIEDAVQRQFLTWSEAHGARWRAVDGYVGPGYAQTTEAAMQEHSEVGRVEGLIVDPVYTGKAFRALSDLEPVDGATVFLHTGGIFELWADR